ncbi:MAG: glutamine--fructose-6-phosphate transaminase (isomerizing) [Alphaproteobacteria bacterium]|nr:glutamine--fructose-6-phosphate transaminase (isomerizing) [Alphaproteobacteria bacterium]
MCGIIGIVGNKPVGPRLIHGLEKLEYRGYDSAGIATIYEGEIHRLRAEGKLVNLKAKFLETPLKGYNGIGHTRWATHGQPIEINAHPLQNPRVAVVHNGIIENYGDLRKDLDTKGYVFESETDTEVIAHLIAFYIDKECTPQEAVSKTLNQLKGAFALAILFTGYENLLIAARQGGSPLAIGYGEGEMYVGSDAIALASLTQQISYLEDGDWAVLSPEEVRIFNKEGHPVERPIVQSHLSENDISKGSYDHFMLKEIYEQPRTIETTIAAYYRNEKIDIPALPWSEISRLTISACGTAYYAGFIAKYWFERIARLSVEVDIASEFRYRTPPLPEKGLGLLISQSGETIDTLAALEYMKSQGQTILSLVNVLSSSIARQSDHVLLTHAGPEIGVASTKAFTSQLTVLALLVLEAARQRGYLTEESFHERAQTLRFLPALCEKVFLLEEQIKSLSTLLAKARDVLFLGRGAHYPIALEGALKLKEISYIHAEGYAAGEMKHGPIALLDKDVPVIVIAPYDDLFEKTASNLQEVAARGAPTIVLTDNKGATHLGSLTNHLLVLPMTTELTAPIVYTLPLQLLAYHTALLKETDVDQPRNLAKSVTVE